MLRGQSSRHTCSASDKPKHASLLLLWRLIHRRALGHSLHLNKALQEILHQRIFVGRCIT